MFKELRNLSNGAEKESKAEKSIEDMEQELSDLCDRNDNPIVFHRHGSEIPKVISPLRKFEGEIGDEEYKKILNMIKERFIDYLHGPIFTDSFHHNHPSRRLWQGQAGGDLEKELMESDLYEYYESNCLNANRWLSVSMLQQIYKNLDFQYPKELKASLDKIFAESDKDIPKIEIYNHASDEEKIAFIFKIESVMKKILAVITVESKD